LTQVQGLTDAQGIPKQEGYVAALAACDQALKVDPDNVNAWSQKSAIYADWAVTARLNKGEPIPLYDKAIEMANKALALKPDFSDAINNLGNAYVHLAFYQEDTGIERTKTIERAIEAFQDSIKIRPTDLVYCDLGDAYSDHAVALQEKGIDPMPSFTKSSRAYENAIRLNPRFSRFYSNLGINQARMGRYQLRHGQNPTSVLKGSIESYSKALQINPKYFWAQNNIGLSLTTLAQYEMSELRDPTELLDQAMQAFQKTQVMNQESNLPTLVMARAQRTQAEYFVLTEKDPQVPLDAARGYLRTFMQTSGGTLGAIQDEASMDLIAAEWSLLQGRSAAGFITSAKSLLRKSLEHNPEDPETFRRFAKAYVLSAKEQIARKKSAAEEIKEGLLQVGESLKRDNQYGETYALQAQLLSLGGQYAPAKEALTKAFALNANLRNLYEPVVKELANK